MQDGGGIPALSRIRDFDVTGSCDVISPDHFVRGFYCSSFRRCGLNFLVLQKDYKILVHNLSIHKKLEQSTHWNILKKWGKDFTFGSGCTVTQGQCQKCPVSLFLPLDLVFIYKTLPQNFKVRRLTFRNISKRAKTGVFQRSLTLFHRHYSLERNKKNLWQRFLDNFQTKRTKKKSKQIGQEKVALTITGAGVVARKLTFSNDISELLDGAPPAPRWLFHYITVTSRAAGLSRTATVIVSRSRR